MGVNEEESNEHEGRRYFKNKNVATHFAGQRKPKRNGSHRSSHFFRNSAAQNLNSSGQNGTQQP